MKPRLYRKCPSCGRQVQYEKVPGNNCQYTLDCRHCGYIDRILIGTGTTK